ncbi:MAG: pyridoxal-phosphate dependent enzyme [Xanthomonadales bacterium]|nr:putative cystathionine beta-synthase [Xanthomonadales bacterium]MCC6592343.1 pyridoxal-phosphate dependent enzyme [Xanthomonadales bacterium]MCE7930190.1 pyridoxal-phosphate dependent enzyme [Xanthomonadales bacterium PRO6]
MAVYNNVLELIGNTPIVRCQRMDTGPCELYFKMESTNPGGSIKDRIGLVMIEDAERRGQLKPGATIVEGTAGNTGLALALVAQQKGYRLVLVVPDKMSREKIFNLKAMGAEVVLTRSDVTKGHPEYYQDMARRIAEETPGAVYINQFGNPSNPIAHEFGTGPEIWQQMGHEMDAMVFGVGSGGTLTGLSNFFTRAAPHVELILADPVGSVLTRYVNEQVLDTTGGSWTVEGIGGDYLTAISDFRHVRKAYAISDRESFEVARELLKSEGILGGSSTGTVIAAALRYCREQSTRKKVVAFVCDTGNKYLSKMYNDYWMRDNGYIARESTGDLRDLINRPYSERDTIVVRPHETLTVAYQRMKLYDVSQLPVMDGDRIVGIVDESDVLLKVHNAPGQFQCPVSEAMITTLDAVDMRSDINTLLPLFERGHVAIVMDGERFIGLITRMDLLNYLRRRSG